MTYLQATKRPYQRAKNIITAIIVILVVIVIALQLFASHLFPSLISAVARPFWRSEFSIENGALKTPSQLLDENESLIRQLTDAQVRLDTIKATELENAELKAFLGREVSVQNVDANGSTTNISSTILVHPKGSIKSIEKRILAAVLKRPPFSPYDEIIIDIGKDSNLSTSSLVYAPGDVLIGRVQDVLGDISKVKLFSSPGEKFEVMIGSQHAPAVAVGRGGGQYESQVSRDTVINEGDFVINSSLNNKPFGVVSAVLRDPTQTFETVLFAPPVNLYQLRWVLVQN